MLHGSMLEQERKLKSGMNLFLQMPCRFDRLGMSYSFLMAGMKVILSVDRF